MFRADLTLLAEAPARTNSDPIGTIARIADVVDAANRPALPKINIDLPYLKRLWRRQKGCCALTGAPLEFSGPFGVTIDRTTPARGYTKRNVRLVGRSANAAKYGMTTAEFHCFIIQSYRWLRLKKLAR
ncbi:hypothetical protein E4K64_19575 [Bradyrhizobium frederickii]|uniref:Uncharacterized protein n=1 Tax=Bradyrhizobium frederickii TaxID=2560054 RepID=A0A4Y9P1U8_9BRAD|nr:hypothetical protein [Bradyrhizobium frederickii]TFV74184.1 hypothetical protein E4K64_19575 [Bradyrhizobium frederickii]